MMESKGGSALAMKAILCNVKCMVSTIQSLWWTLSMLQCICLYGYWLGSRFAMAVLGCMSLVLVINNQVLRKIKIAVKSDVKNWAYISLR